jgi:hypothetical protein
VPRVSVLFEYPELQLLFLMAWIFSLISRVIMSRDSSVGVETGYRLGGRGVIVRVPVWARLFFSPRHSIQWLQGALHGIKQPRHEADYSPPSSAQVKNGGAVPPLPDLRGIVLN